MTYNQTKWISNKFLRYFQSKKMIYELIHSLIKRYDERLVHLHYITSHKRITKTIDARDEVATYRILNTKW